MRASIVWTVFAVGLAVAVGALAWSSAVVLRLERAESVAQSQAVLEENVRLALWRMDSAVTPLIGRESARPYFQYSAFYPAGGAYGRIVADTAPAEALVPSPLLRETPPRVVLHFQVAPDGAISSPQVPTGLWRQLVERDPQLVLVPARRVDEARRLTELKTIVRAIPSRPPPPPSRRPPTPIVEYDSFSRSGSGRRPSTPTPVPVPSATPVPPTPPIQSAEPAFSQRARNYAEFENRQQAVLANSNSTIVVPTPRVEPDAQPAKVVRRTTAIEVEEGALAPVWAGDALLLVRTVRVHDAVYTQGCWLDWPRVEQDLLASIRDLLPSARLEPATAPDAKAAFDDERRLAALPVRLRPGPPPPVANETLSPVRFSLIGAWSGLLVAAVSVAGLLYGVMALSERRRMFVSAVTHELRTPLTTFRLYTDMLAEGMVPTEEKRRAYLRRLQNESQRLGHLVENVLFYARLEGGRAAVREALDVREVVEATLGRLRERAQAAGLELALAAGGREPMRVRADRSALEQIVVNLVDNACKYAVPSNPARVDVELHVADGRVFVHVRDHGPGLTASDRRRLFRPFSKSDREAAASAPGVGLGLALSRRLARAQGGDLRVDDTREGAAFVLSLPLEP